jgi:glycerophosphoryl diester phosphodiesterase
MGKKMKILSLKSFSEKTIFKSPASTITPNMEWVSMNKWLEQRSYNSPWIIAHRGFKQKYPENTLVAFQAAMDAGVPMIELDVTLSRDRKLIVIHDATLERTTNGHGPVHDYTLEELKQLDAGSWFHPDFAGQRLPELAEVLELVDGRVITNIEIKTHAYEPHHPPDAIEKQVVELVKKKNLQDSILISSFDSNVLQQISLMEAPPQIALISKRPLKKNIVEICKHLKTFSWHPDQQIVTPSQVRKLRAAGIRVFPYNVDTPEDCARLRAMKVDGVITDDPVSARRWSEVKKAA